MTLSLSAESASVRFFTSAAAIKKGAIVTANRIPADVTEAIGIDEYCGFSTSRAFPHTHTRAGRESARACAHMRYKLIYEIIKFRVVSSAFEEVNERGR